MRIWCQLPLQFDEREPRIRRFYELTEHALNGVKREGTEVKIAALDRGIRSMEWLEYPGFRFLNEREIVRGCLQGEANGYDGIVVANYFDLGLLGTRQLCSLPVAGFAESTMHFACMAGNKFAVVIANRNFTAFMEKTIEQCGLRPRAIDRMPVRSLSITYDEIMSCLIRDPERLIDDFKKTAKGCIDEGAEVIVAGGGLFSVILTHAGMRELDCVPVFDPFVISLKTCEMMIDLHNAGMPVLSRKRMYCTPPPGDVSKAIEFFFNN